MNVINVTSLRNTSPIEGFDGWIVKDPINLRHHEGLHRSFPTTNFRTAYTRPKPSDSSHDYLGGFLDIYTLDITTFGPKLASLDPNWQSLVVDLLSEFYDELLTSVIGVSLASTRKVIRFMRYRAGGFLGIHFDNQPNKILTQVFYSNLRWEPSWGGYLELLSVAEDGRATVLQSVPPLVSYSIINRSTPRAYHRVSRVSDTAIYPRQTFLMEWYAYESRVSHE